jgi:DNA-binding CsgD family transcriptional regulator
MIKLLVYIIFIFSSAFASAGIILSTRLRNQYKSGYFTTLLYFQVFIFTFGFYGIWGQVVLKTFLQEVASAALLDRFSNISILMGLPFLVFAWLMLTRFAREVSGRVKSNWYIIWFLLLNLILLFGLGFFMTRKGETKPEIIIRYYFIGLNTLYTIISALYIIFPGHHKTLIHKYEGLIFSSGIIIIMVAQCITLGLYNGEPLTGIAFIFLFFAGNCFIPLYFSYGIVLSMFMQEPGRDVSYEEFCRVFEITQRESEIIPEVCNGLSNKEISDKLFITLQTVKDHTHRIYIKTGVKSRVQLINLVKETKK